MSEQRYPLLVDLKTFQVGCAIMQAARGCQAGQSPAFQLFDTCHWFLSPTENMQVIAGTLDEFKKFRAMCEKARKA